eukprot:TRINITY_DN7833_c0_g7_i1.p1 TRINITY_DN7833_c0_g7~~TRINITY_DN7833_c0_g7_i1.p1  ORF type:complete len:463 (+),score=128.67 TRINITY_DN7833_c0_g7_i1:32-1390(+)
MYRMFGTSSAPAAQPQRAPADENAVRGRKLASPKVTARRALADASNNGGAPAGAARPALKPAWAQPSLSQPGTLQQQPQQQQAPAATTFGLYASTRPGPLAPATTAAQANPTASSILPSAALPPARLLRMPEVALPPAPAMAAPVFSEAVAMSTSATPERLMQSLQLGSRPGGPVVPVAPVEDIDDLNDAQLVGEYAQEIYDYLREKELREAINGQYMDIQTEISGAARCVLVDWLSEVHAKFKLHQETLFLAISYLDRFLECSATQRKHLQLVGCSTLLLACKMEEIFCPEMKEFVYLSEEAFSENQMVFMETLVLERLQFNLAVVTVVPFLRRFLRAASANTMVSHLGSFFAEMALLEVTINNFLPSLVASSAVYLAIFVATGNRGQTNWTASVKHYSEYELEELRPCIAAIVAVVNDQTVGRGVRTKFASSKYGSVSQHARLPLISTAL